MQTFTTWLIYKMFLKHMQLVQLISLDSCNQPIRLLNEEYAHCLKLHILVGRPLSFKRIAYFHNQRFINTSSLFLFDRLKIKQRRTPNEKYCFRFN